YSLPRPPAWRHERPRCGRRPRGPLELTADLGAGTLHSPVMGLSGRATAAGTARFAGRRAAAPGHFREAAGWTVSSIGLGPYLGPENAAADAGYPAAIGRALAMPCNVLDSAVNYRGQRSERALGRALAAAVEAGAVARDEVVVATKGGFVTHDSERP